MTVNRRSLLKYLSALSVAVSGGALSASAGESTAAKLQLGQPEPFSKSNLLSQVKALAATPYQAPKKIPKPWIDLTYDEYRGINFRGKSALWRGSDRPFETEFFAPGLYFPSPIKVSIVDGNQQQPILFSKDVFRFSTVVPDLPVDDSLGYSGFRIRAAINDPERTDEFVVFQGASYFRAVGRDQAYGLSARGLALKTAEPEGEEFPDFRSFWIEGGLAGSKMITVHALMDSPSVAGLYTFHITPGAATEMDVEAVLYPRTNLDHVGIAAETSMFLFDETSSHRFDDFRPSVHDSDGLLIENGAGEILWRQLANPLTLQVSNFVDNNPRGFGLMQRPRNFRDFADLEANYHRRPGLWVMPGEDWGKGSVTLVEIPADREIYDNIVAYWRPRVPMAAGSEHKFTYKLYWCEEAPQTKPMARVINTRMGKRFKGGRIAAIDFDKSKDFPKDLSELTIHVSANGGEVSRGILQRNPETGGVRLAFTFDPKDRSSLELRAQILMQGKPVSEVWLYRWTS